VHRRAQHAAALMLLVEGQLYFYKLFQTDTIPAYYALILLFQLSGTSSPGSPGQSPGGRKMVVVVVVLCTVVGLICMLLPISLLFNRL